MESTGYYTLGVIRKDSEPTRIRFTRHTLDIEAVVERDLPDATSYELRVDLAEGASRWNYQHHEFVFSVRNEESTWEEIGRGTCRFLSTELIGGGTSNDPCGLADFAVDRERPFTAQLRRVLIGGFALLVRSWFVLRRRVGLERIAGCALRLGAR